MFNFDFTDLTPCTKSGPFRKTPGLGKKIFPIPLTEKSSGVLACKSSFELLFKKKFFFCRALQNKYCLLQNDV